MNIDQTQQKQSHLGRFTGRPEMALRGVMAVTLLVCVVVPALLLAGVAAAETTVKVSTTPIYPRIPRGQTSKDFQVLVRVEAPPETETRRAPIDLVAVLDVSGSMKDPAAAPVGKPSKLDLLKTAMKFVVRKLDDADRLSVVAFNDGPVKAYSTGLLDISGDGRSNAVRSVERLSAGGGTAFLPALEDAVKILDGRAADGRNHVGFIILLTDGEDTSGFRLSESEIHGVLSKYPVHTFGFGAAHDAMALLSIAQASRGGTYSFIDEKITEAFAICLGGLNTVVAVDTRVTLKAADKVQIKRIKSGGYASHVSCSGTSGDIDVGILYAGEVKNFVVHLHVPAVSSPPSVEASCHFTVCDHHQQQLLDVSYSYSHAPGIPAISTSGGGGHGVFVERPEIVVDDAAAGQKAPSPTVLQHIVHFEMLETMASVVYGELTGHLELASALESKWEELRRAHQFWVGVDLAVLEKDVDAMVSGLRHGGGAGVAFILSWVSSHRLQRATCMGTPDKVVVEYLTPAMLRMLEEARKITVVIDHAADGCARADLDKIIDQRLQLWSRVKREVPLMYRSSTVVEDAVDGEPSDHVTAVFRQASREAIDRAMYHDMYLAVVHAKNQKERCECHHSYGTDKL